MINLAYSKPYGAWLTSHDLALNSFTIYHAMSNYRAMCCLGIGYRCIEFPLSNYDASINLLGALSTE